MENVLALGNLDKVLALIEEIPTHGAHILRDHPVFVAGIALLKSPVGDFLEVLEIDADDVFSVVRFLFSPTAASFSLTVVIEVGIGALLSPVMGQVEADHLDQHNYQEKEHGSR